MWTPLESLFVATKQKIKCRCQCERESYIRARELIDGKTYCCRSCSTRLRVLKIPVAERIVIARRASSVAAALSKLRVDPYRDKYGEEAFKQVSCTGRSAKQRCTNPNCRTYSDYGGRGVEFKFPSVRSFTEWVLDNIGPRPTPFHSIDRIDNNRHYEPGNLRWATRSEQARNKRVYKRTKNGERIKNLKELRPDLSYETIRLWIVQGATDDEILNRNKYARPGI
jgi:hypothetical protein